MSTINIVQTKPTNPAHFQKGIWFALSVFFAAVALYFLLYLIINSPLQRQEITSTVNGTSLQVDRALARGTSLDSILQNQNTYIDHTFKNMAVTISAGSCGVTSKNAYTVTTTDAHGNFAVFTTTGNQSADGRSNMKDAVLTQICGN